jgi:PadR family transcriptional regulator, regulatory protein AphA
MSLDHILLGLLRQPASGYELKATFDDTIGHFWAAELSQIYPTLKRLQAKGWLRSHKAPSKRGAGKLVYQTTPAGRRVLREWLSSGPQLGNDDRFAYVAQIFLMDELGDLEATRRFFVSLREVIAAKLAKLHAIERLWAEQDPRFPDELPALDFHMHITLRMGVMTLETKLNWCDETLARIDRRQTPRGMRRVAATARQ